MHLLAVVKGEELLNYSFPEPHPLNKRRLKMFYSAIEQEESLKDRILFIKPVISSKEEIALFHEKSYIDYVKIKSEMGSGYLDYGDTPAYKGCYEAAAYVVGSSLELAKNILKGNVLRGFNPMGGLHHAMRGSAGGFCIFNDPGVVISYLLEKVGLKSIAYVDIDAHHGDGVMYPFYSDKRVIIVDIHQDGKTLYPGTGFRHETGEGEAVGTKLNIPLPPGASDREFFAAFEEAINFLEKFKFDFLIFQSGADCLKGDPLTGLAYSLRSHSYAANKLKEIAIRKCKGRLLALGGGGYNAENVAKAWMEVVKSLAIID